MPITAEQVRGWSKVDFAGLDYPAPTPPADDTLQVLVNRASEYVLDVTGLGSESAVPSGLTLTWEEAVQRRTEQLAFKAQEDEAETAADFDLIKSFGAGSYNETRRDMGDVEKGKQINPWPLLNDLLWRLATDAAKDEWMERWGVVVPAFAVSEVDWNGTLLVPPESQGF
jgi:hypothetical protein